MECQICLQYVEGEQWGIIPVEIKSLDADPDNDWVDFVHDHVSFVVHPYCMNEAVEFYTQDLADGFIENVYIEEASRDAD